MRFLSILILFCCVAVAQAQVGLELALNRSIYLTHEPIFAKVKMRNFSGQPLVFGEDERLRGEVLFEFIGPDQRVIPARSGSFSMVGTILMPGESKELIIPISAYYTFDRPGIYRGHVYVKHALLNEMFKSNDCRLEVNDGIPICRASVGVPDVLRIDGATEEKVKTRDYILKSLTENTNKHYYLQIEDSKNLFAVFHVGREVGVERYKVEIDMFSRLHLIVPISPRIYHYNIFNLNGKVELDQYLKTTKTVPSLLRDPQSGVVQQVGGAEALPGIDYEVKKGVSSNAASSPLGLPPGR